MGRADDRDRLREECAAALAEAGMEKLELLGEVSALRQELLGLRSGDGVEDGRRSVSAAVDAVLEAAASDGFRGSHGDALCNLLWWLVSTGRRKPALARALHLVRTRLGGVVRRGAAAELAPLLGCDERTVRRYLDELEGDAILGGCVVWTKRRGAV